MSPSQGEVVKLKNSTSSLNLFFKCTLSDRVCSIECTVFPVHVVSLLERQAGVQAVHKVHVVEPVVRDFPDVRGLRDVRVLVRVGRVGLV